jgi:hypothetical protein
MDTCTSLSTPIHSQPSLIRESGYTNTVSSSEFSLAEILPCSLLLLLLPLPPAVRKGHDRTVQMTAMSIRMTRIMSMLQQFLIHVFHS